MTWAKLSDNFHSHPKVLAMGFRAAGLYAMGLSYAAAHLTDGFLPGEWVRIVLRNERRSGVLVARLVSVNAWAKDTLRDGYWIVDFLDYNISRQEMSQKRAEARERVTRYRANERNALHPEQDPTRIGPDKDKGKGKGNAVANQETVRVDIPQRLDLKSEVSEYAHQLRDATDSTWATLLAYRQQLPEAAFRTALESLNERRTRKPPLLSETRYFVAALKSMAREGQYQTRGE